MRTLYLVSCVAKKLEHPAEAKDIYVSPWFRLARAYVESTGQTWGILSAKHGFLRPHAVIDPYEETLNNKSPHDRFIWAHRVLFQIREYYGGDTFDRHVLLAGRKYAEHIVPILQCETPLKGLGIGQQLAWFKRQLSDGPQ